MLDWIRSFFAKEQPDRYVISVRQYEVARAKTLEEAEQYLRDTFNEVDSRHKGGQGFGTHQSASYDQRWKGFRSQCKITHIKS